MNSVRIKAYGKVNIGLDVTAKRADGYHEVKMVMQTVNIYDKLNIAKISAPRIKISTNLHYVPTNENNLIYKAAKLLFDEFGIKGGVEIHLHKFIPVSAGMAGGSSDAAATLLALNRLYGLGLSAEELMGRGIKLGADVPYCVMCGTALAEGIGEKLTKLPPMPNCFVVIAKPGFSISTRQVYQNLKVEKIKRHPDINGIVKAIEEGNLYGVTSRMHNVLENVTVKEYPVIQLIKELMVKNGALNSIMSGSGPTVFGLFDEAKKAKRALRMIKESKLSKQLYLTDLYNVN